MIGLEYPTPGIALQEQDGKESNNLNLLLNGDHRSTPVNHYFPPGISKTITDEDLLYHFSFWDKKKVKISRADFTGIAI